MTTNDTNGYLPYDDDTFEKNLGYHDGYPDGDAMQKSGTGDFPWYMAGFDASETSFSVPELEGATLLYVPESKEHSA